MAKPGDGRGNDGAHDARRRGERLKNATDSVQDAGIALSSRSDTTLKTMSERGTPEEDPRPMDELGAEKR